MPATMKAGTWIGKVNDVSVEKLPKPTLLNPLDGIVQLTTVDVCSSDLHTYHGFFGSREPPCVLGREVIGIVTEIGQGVNCVDEGRP